MSRRHTDSPSLNHSSLTETTWPRSPGRNTRNSTARPPAMPCAWAIPRCIAEIEHDYAVPGDECLHGGGKTLRDGLGLTPGYDSAQGALDMLISNAVIIDPVLGVVKGDIGIKDGKIVAIGKAGNPATMDGVHPKLICGAATTVRDAEGSDRHARRHRRARALRQRATGRARHRFRADHHDRRVARARSPLASTAAASGTWARCCRPPSSGR